MKTLILLYIILGSGIWLYLVRKIDFSNFSVSYNCERIINLVVRINCLFVVSPQLVFTFIYISIWVYNLDVILGGLVGSGMCVVYAEDLDVCVKYDPNAVRRTGIASGLAADVVQVVNGNVSKFRPEEIAEYTTVIKEVEKEIELLQKTRMVEVAIKEMEAKRKNSGFNGLCSFFGTSGGSTDEHLAKVEVVVHEAMVDDYRERLHEKIEENKIASEAYMIERENYRRWFMQANMLKKTVYKAFRDAPILAARARIDYEIKRAQVIEDFFAAGDLIMPAEVPVANQADMAEFKGYLTEMVKDERQMKAQERRLIEKQLMFKAGIECGDEGQLPVFFMLFKLELILGYLQGDIAVLAENKKLVEAAIDLLHEDIDEVYWERKRAKILAKLALEKISRQNTAMHMGLVVDTQRKR